MERITIELPIIKVNVGDNYLGSEYAKEHYGEGLFLIDDGISQTLVGYDGVGCIWSMPCPVRLVQDSIEEEAAKRERERCAEVLEGINDRLSQIARMLGETKDEVGKSETRLMDVIVEEGEVRDREFNTLRDGLEALECSRGGGDMGGVNILDVARSFAVIQKPELIKELNK